MYGDENMKKFLEKFVNSISPPPEEIDKDVREYVINNIDEIVERVVQKLAKFDEIKVCLEENNLAVETASKLFKEFYKFVFESKASEDYVKKVAKVSFAHIKSGVSQSLITLTFNLFTEEIVDFLRERYRDQILDVLSWLHWTYNIMARSYEKATYLCLEKIKISEELFNRLVSLKAEEIYKELGKIV